MARRHQPLEDTRQDRWVLSYADFITLLLAFFIVMYAISSVNEEKYRSISDALSGVFEGSGRPAGAASQDAARDLTIGNAMRPDAPAIQIDPADAAVTEQLRSLQAELQRQP
jgi:chemotaxis protein MotB